MGWVRATEPLAPAPRVPRVRWRRSAAERPAAQHAASTAHASVAHTPHRKPDCGPRAVCSLLPPPLSISSRRLGCRGGAGGRGGGEGDGGGGGGGAGNGGGGGGGGAGSEGSVGSVVSLEMSIGPGSSMCHMMKRAMRAAAVAASGLRVMMALILSLLLAPCWQQQVPRASSIDASRRRQTTRGPCRQHRKAEARGGALDVRSSSEAVCASGANTSRCTTDADDCPIPLAGPLQGCDGDDCSACALCAMASRPAPPVVPTDSTLASLWSSQLRAGS